MKPARQLLPKIEELSNLELAFWKAAKGKRSAPAVLAYQAELSTNLLALQQQIRTGAVQVGNYRTFLIYEPKERKICASAFSEQVLHHALLNVCHDRFEAAQIFDSYASRKGKGTSAAIRRAQRFVRGNQWYLKLDLRKFFESIPHEILKRQLLKLFKEKRLLQIFFAIIDSYAATPGRGLPIGNLTSQYFANHFLSGLDHYIKQDLRCHHYLRYMDDLVLLAPDKATLQGHFRAISTFVADRLNMSLKPPQLNQLKFGLPFLGYRVFADQLWLLQKSKQRFIRKARRIVAHYDDATWSEYVCQQRMQALIAFTRPAAAKKFRQMVFRRGMG